MTRMVVALGLVVVTGTASFAQAPAPGTAKPAAPAPRPAAPAPAPAAQAPAPPPAQVLPFPEGAKIAFVVLQRVVAESAEGKLASARVQTLQQKKVAELNERQKSAQTLQEKLDKSGAVMSEAARADLQKQVERAQVDLQRASQDAQQEVQELQQQLQEEFQRRIAPIIEQVGKEKGLHYIFNGPDSGLVWADASLDITNEVVKKFDASSKPAAPAKPQGQ
ncbi:MAG: OmpH family outer membrane protein [Vicinamibacterales bacterium]